MLYHGSKLVVRTVASLLTYGKKNIIKKCLEFKITLQLFIQ